MTCRDEERTSEEGKQVKEDDLYGHNIILFTRQRFMYIYELEKCPSINPASKSFHNFARAVYPSFQLHSLISAVTN